MRGREVQDESGIDRHRNVTFGFAQTLHGPYFVGYRGLSHVSKAKTAKTRTTSKRRTSRTSKKAPVHAATKAVPAPAPSSKHALVASPERAVVPCVLAIGGLDPGGGAGVLADARAIARAGAFACAAIALLTVQSTSGLRSATPTATKQLTLECMEVLRAQNIRAIKVGALGNEENVKAVGDLLAIHRDVPSIVDTVMLPTRGSGRLLEERGVAILRKHMLRHATLVTANVHEAEVLTGRRITRLDEARAAAISLLSLGSKAVLLKGGHLTGASAIDLLVLKPDEKEGRPSGRKLTAPEPRVVEIEAPRLRLSRPVHGGGCSLASLIAGRLAHGVELVEAVRWAKKLHHAALAKASNVGGDMRVLFAAG